MTRTKRSGRWLGGWYRGATHLGLADVIIVLIVLAILLWASWRQFPAYEHMPAPAALETSAPGPVATPAARAPQR